ncbi:hypothetical protein C8A05DRAFT_19503 [Staphylotrichum tortipilum]|uniref:Uncharacterized protein n=1 Tax=Staphylotrichum tortipilum TaxID=2831512 RepID=A0AAN6RPA3_9PEZI|nr:hypothetical protein C8A05DRAFT_19503 [Staphylotrichum longicolle]
MPPPLPSPSPSNPDNSNPNPNPDSPSNTTIIPVHPYSPSSAETPRTAPQAALAWHAFLSRSPYSPLRLHLSSQPHHHHHHPFPQSPLAWDRWDRGWDRWDRWDRPCDPRDYPDTFTPDTNPQSHPKWQPTPRDLPAGCSPGEFGWLDAFEDLMRVSSGLEMVDLRQRAGENCGLEGVRGWDWGERAWMGRMGRGGFGEVMFPVWDEGAGWRSPATMEEWVERRRVEAERREAWEGLWEGREREGEDGRRTGWLEEITGAVGQLAKELEDEVRSSLSLGEKPRREASYTDTDKHKDKDPETETDLYSAVKSAFHESERSLTAFFKSLSRGLPSPSKPASESTTETTEVLNDGLTKKTTHHRSLDARGTAHTRTETTWTNADGRVVMKQVHTSVGPAEAKHWGQDASEDGPGRDQEKETETEAVDEHQPTQQSEPQQQQPQKIVTSNAGWFWK